jgi:hypothetical protein
MRRMTILIAMVLMTSSALAQDNATPRKFDQEAVTSTVEKSAAAPVDPQAAQAQREMQLAMNEEISGRITAEEAAVAELAAKLATTPDSQARLELQRQISETKNEGWRDILAIQLKYANLGGHTDQATELRERLVRLDEGLSPTQTVNSAAKSTRTRAQDGVK